MSREAHTSIDGAINAMMKLSLETLKEAKGETAAEAIALALVKSAVFDGDLSTQKLLLERTSGRVGVKPQPVESNELLEKLKGMW